MSDIPGYTEAVEAAAKADYERMAGDGLQPWAALAATFRDSFRANVEPVVAAALPFLERAVRDGGDTFTEWAVQYDGGVQGCDDEAQAEEWQQWLIQPNRVVSREIHRGPWVARGGEATE